MIMKENVLYIEIQTLCILVPHLLWEISNLIWMVQLIVYPSFLFFSDNNLFTWHKSYTKAIALIVIPLMLGQLGIVIYQVFLAQNIYTLVSIVFVVFLWGITLLKFAPMHQQISKGNMQIQLLKTLVQRKTLIKKESMM